MFGSMFEKEESYFLWNNIYLKKFPWTHRTVAWPDFQLFAAKSQKKFSSKSE